MARRTGCRRNGSVSAEFSLVLIVFLTLAGYVMELARAVYLFNMLPAVTYRAATLAANTDFTDPDAMDAVRQRAMLRNTPGGLLFGAPITEEYVRIEYLAVPDAPSVELTAIPASDMPSCPANNRAICVRDPNAAGCIRMVRAQICDPATTEACNRPGLRNMFAFAPLPIPLPRATVIVAAETLGAVAGAAPCP